MRKRVSQQPSFYRVVRAEGTLRLMAIGWDMAGEAEESLAPTVLPVHKPVAWVLALQAFPQQTVSCGAQPHCGW